LPKLLIWYDHFRTYIVEEAGKEGHLPNDSWIPDVVHRFCVRVQLGMSHQPKALNQASVKLKGLYDLHKPWNYGEVIRMVLFSSVAYY
jgi:hypothetical protein